MDSETNTEENRSWRDKTEDKAQKGGLTGDI